MSTPRRVQRRRTKGWKMPEGAVYVGRPTKWGNPYKPEQYESFLMGLPHLAIERCVDSYRELILANQQSTERFRLPLAELRGKDLVCWCPLDQPCHADVLLELANSNNSAQFPSTTSTDINGEGPSTDLSRREGA